MAYATINPATGETVKEFETASDQEVRDTVARSAEEYKSWRNVPVAERAAMMHRMAELYRERQDELADYESETGGYSMLGASLGYSGSLNQTDYLLYLKANNLLDEKARQHTSFIKDEVLLPGRNLTVGVRLAF